MADDQNGLINEIELAETHGEIEEIQLQDLEAHQPEEMLARPPRRRNIFETRFCRSLMIVGGVIFLIGMVIVARDLANQKHQQSDQPQPPMQPPTKPKTAEHNAADDATEMETLFTVDQRGGQPLVVEMSDVTDEDAWRAEVSVSKDYRMEPRMVKHAKHGVVAADRGRCSEIGVQLMKNKNGNAADAAICTALCEGILSPSNSGLGGGAFIVVRHPDGTTASIDGREKAPAAATADMFEGHQLLASTGGKSIAIPTELKALDRLLTIAGSLQWADLVEPIIPLAREGFKVTPFVAAEIRNLVHNLQAWPLLGQTFLVKTDDGKYRVPEVGEMCCQRPKLAALLEKIGEQGAAALYNQETAKTLAAEIQVSGGVITADDIMNVEVQDMDPYVANVLGHEVVTMGLPSSAAVLPLGLQILGLWDDWKDIDEGLEAHRLIEVMRQMFALRLHMGDVLRTGGPEENAVVSDVQKLLQQFRNESFATELWGDLKDDATLDRKEYGGPFELSGITPDDAGTSHISVVDDKGLAVSMTTTINGRWGSLVVSPSTGILLNNEMDDFSVADFPKIADFPPNKANFVQPNKQPLSSMSPTIVSKDGELKLVLGASGGTKILTALLNVLYRVLLKDADIAAAVQSPRLHDSLGTKTEIEQVQYKGYPVQFSDVVQEELQRRGHDLEKSVSRSAVQIVEVQMRGDRRLYSAVSDLRKDGAAAGY